MMSGFMLGLIAGFSANTPYGKRIAGMLEQKVREIAKAAIDNGGSDEQQKNSGNSAQGSDG